MTDAILNEIFAKFGIVDESLNEESIKLKLQKVKELIGMRIEKNQVISELINAKINDLSKLKKEKENFDAEYFRVQQGTMMNDIACQELQESCRKLQIKSKENQEGYANLLEQEQNKTYMLTKECNESIMSISNKVMNEENDINQKEEENKDLNEKLLRFNNHLTLRNEHIQHLKHTRDLEKQLTEARKAQLDYHENQRETRNNSYLSQIRHLEDTISQIKVQLHMFGSKFVEFEDTINKSSDVINQFDERLDILEKLSTKLNSDNVLLRDMAKQEDVKLINGLAEKNKLEDLLKSKKSQLEILEKKCRKLQKKRKEILEKQQLVIEKRELESKQNDEVAMLQASVSSSSSSNKGINHHMTPASGMGGDETS
eukprot:gene9043-12192_t